MFLRKNTKWFKILALTTVLLISLTSIALAAVWTDQADYSPGSVVTISGDNSDNAGYSAGETVHVDVSGPNGYAASCEAAADDYGVWSCQVALWDNELAVGAYTYTTTGKISNVSQSGTFTDAKPDCNLVVSISSPNNGAIFTAATFGGTASVNYSWTSSGDYNYTTSVRVDGSEISTGFSGSTTLNLSVGNHTLQVRADVMETPAPCQNPNRVANVTITIQNPSDVTPPLITYTLNPASADGSNSWYKSNVTLTWSVTDLESPLSITKTGCVNQNINTDQPATTYSCSASSTGGSAGPVTVSIKRDATAPGVTWSGGISNGDSFVYGSVPQAPTCSATDSGSGPDACSVTGYGDSVGGFTLTATAYDKAGNLKTETRSYTVTQAQSTVVVSCPTSVVYNGSAQMPCTAKASGVGMSDVDVTASLVYTNYTNAGSASSTASWAGDTNHTGSSSSAGFEITPAPVTLTAGSYSGTYDGDPHSPTACVVTGVYKGTLTCTNNPTSVGPNVASGSVTPVLVPNSETSTNFSASPVSGSWEITQAPSTVTVTCPVSVVYDGLAQTPCTAKASGVGMSDVVLNASLVYANNTNAGPAIADASWGGDANHFGNTGSGGFEITKADATCTVTPYDVIYDTTEHIATGTCTGVGTDGILSGLILDETKHTNAGTYTDSWSFTDITGNYNNSSDTITDKIAKATTTTLVTCLPGPYEYTGSAITPCSASVSGPGLNQALTVYYTDNINAGTVTSSASYAESDNYLASSDSETFTIDPAPSTTIVSFEEGPYIYRASDFTATANVTGIGGLNEPLEVFYSGDCRNVTIADGCISTATYGGDPNHYGSSDTKSITITKADVSCLINGYSDVYDASFHGVSGSCPGIGGENAGTLDLGATFKDVPGGTAHWTFTGNRNYNDNGGDAAIVISKADATCTINGYTGVYDSAFHGATGLCSGVGGENAGSLSLGLTFKNVPGGTAYWNFTGTGNYYDQDGSVPIVINKANASCTVTPYNVVYDHNAHTATGSCTGVGSDGTLTGLDLSGTTHTNPGDYQTDAWVFTDSSGNYNNASGTVPDNIHFALVGGMCGGGPGHTILQPINVDGTSVWKARNTIPVKFRVCDAFGHSIGGDVTLVFDLANGKSAVPYLQKVLNGSGTVDESAVSNTPDPQFRWSASDQQWIFNLNTNNLSGGKTYEYNIYLIDGSIISFKFGLK